MMTDVLIKQLAAAAARRLGVFAERATDGSLLEPERETELRMAAYMISELVRPCCCMVCNKAKLQEIIAAAGFCGGNTAVERRLAQLVYDDLARCNGLG